MKNFKKLTVLFAGIAIAVIFMGSCKKGADGPPGSQGVQGTVGGQGALGANGLNGNTLLNGLGAPADSLGKIGDFYIDLTGMQLYGPKTVSGWGTSVSVQGPQGQTGANGNANVVIDTFTVANADWADKATYSHVTQFDPGSGYVFPGMDYIRPLQAIDSSILATGLVMVDVNAVWNYPGYANRWIPIPYSFYGGSWTYNLDYLTDLYQVKLDFYLTRLVANTGANPSSTDVQNVDLPTYKVKIVVIAGTTVAQISDIMKKKTAAKVSVN
jgi:hypothetical protein